LSTANETELDYFDDVDCM